MASKKCSAGLPVIPASAAIRAGAGQGARRQQPQVVGLRGQLADLTPLHADQWLGGDRLLHPGREFVAVHGQRRARRHGSRAGAVQQAAAQPVHLVLEQLAGGGRGGALEGIGADDLGQAAAAVGGSRDVGAHLHQAAADAAGRQLQRRLAAGQAAADHGHGGHQRRPGGGLLRRSSSWWAFFAGAFLVDLLLRRGLLCGSSASSRPS